MLTLLILYGSKIQENFGRKRQDGIGDIYEKNRKLHKICIRKNNIELVLKCIY